jgi:hypothetical protein
MVLMAAGQGGAPGPVIAGGIAAVAPEDAGAAGGVTNVAHQIGGSRGFAVLVAVFASADADGAVDDGALRARPIAASITAGAILLARALVIALARASPGSPPCQSPVSAPAAGTGVAAPEAPVKRWRARSRTSTGPAGHGAGRDRPAHRRQPDAGWMPKRGPLASSVYTASTVAPSAAV